MKRILLFAICLCSAVAYAQNEVSLVVSADGATKTQAIDNALRSAIEQTFGTFVSANTQILNDELVKDEIATVSSGNIQKYSEIAAVTLPNGNTSVTLNVTVSLAKLISYAQSKGSECEFAGATFAANLRLYEFNKKNEQVAIQNMIKQLDALRPVYDYEMRVSSPVIDAGSAIINMKVWALKNKKTELFHSIIKNTILSLAMTEEQVQPLIFAGFTFQRYYVYFGERSDPYSEKTGKYYYLYNAFPGDICDYVLETFWDFSITDNKGDEYVNTIYFSRMNDGFGHCPGRFFKRSNIDEGGDKSHTENPFIFIFTDDEQCTLRMQFKIPISYIDKISCITIHPSLSNKTNKLVERPQNPWGSNGSRVECNFLSKH
ncbi:MAG: hypothetical protein K6E96_03105 [Bacteroidales bacterium]|nr:hypothetical protein [Bacteroidales bacterium]